ncbi:MAG: ParA family protein [Sedimentisphaeraceae bacterium JB056]
MRTIAILNQKGGVGKTTTVANVAAALAVKGKKVLVVDLDPQGHLTIHLGINPTTLETSVYNVLTQSMPISEAMIEARENLYLLGANIDLVGAESELLDTIGREIILRDALEEVQDDFDFLIIDCPPSLGLLSLNALAAVKEIFIPLQPHFLALQGLGKLLETVTLVNKRINPQLRVAGILFCMFDSRTSLSSEVKNDIEEFLLGSRERNCPWSNAELVPIHIRRNVKLAEAPSYGQTIFEYEPNCNGAIDYTEICDYFIDAQAFRAKAMQEEKLEEAANVDN